MIEVIIFYGHVIFLVYIFTKNFIEENFTSALLSSIFIVVIFTVGWTFSAFVIGLFIPDQGLSRILTKAAFSLTFLTILELIFYKFYYGGKKAAKSNLSETAS
ncbi:MAG: hypothetical protein L0Y79_13405 [Chlorobi bacterium]|nr:hypothetical protein [Chlorobiota bacterium]MCI0715192.1 hypothetical protein [Chlorobiota bacterium]